MWYAIETLGRILVTAASITTVMPHVDNVLARLVWAVIMIIWTIRPLVEEIRSG